MAAAVWKGSLSFGLLNIPIRLYPAARKQRIPLHQIHKVCHTRLKQPLYCPHCKRIVDRSEVIRGCEREDGKYVFVTDEELKKIPPPSSRTMQILAFVKPEEIDPI
jgi:DNA end-binding protein Ku